MKSRSREHATTPVHQSSAPTPLRATTLDALASTPFDLLVVGGGITGAGVARDAALRGLRVALVERDDFASGTSSRSSRLVHGGLRYLEHGELALVFESSRERRVLLHIAPHLVRPLRFVWPVYAGARIARWKLDAGLALYDALALFRNVARHRRLRTEQVEAIEPALRRAALVGGASYFDAATDDARLTLATVRAAVAAGAVVANHAAVGELLMRDGAVRGASITADSGRPLHVTARVVVSAVGPWTEGITRLAGSGAAAVRGSKGVHITVRRSRLGNEGAVTMLSPRDGRVMFVLPSGTLTTVGTTETEFHGSPDDVRASASDIDYLLEAANAYFPAAALGRADVISAWAGVRPLADRGESEPGPPGAISREHAIVWTTPGLLTITGGKLTTYRLMGAQAVDLVCGELGRRLHPAPTAQLPLPGGRMASVEGEIAGAQARVGNAETGEHLVHAYGTEWRELWEMTQREPALAARLVPSLPYIAAELRWGVTHEMACTLADILVRRLRIAFELSDHGASIAPEAARAMAPLLGWDAGRVKEELARYRAEVERLFAVDPA